MEFSVDQRKVIESRGKNLLVSAAAGSGKTAVLVERILSLITDEKDRTDLDRILVVTFTVAAAGEMKERIQAALDERLEEDPENEFLRRQAVLIHHAQINTIHSFCSYIIRNYFYRIDVDPVFRVMEEGERKLMFADVLSTVLEEKYASEDPDFIFLAANWFEKKTDSRLEDTIEELYKTAVTTPWPHEWLKNAADAYKLQDDEHEEEADPVTDEERRQRRYCAPAVRALTAVTDELITRFDARKREKGVCDFSDLEHLALLILYEEDENGNRVRSEAAKELSARFKYVMTDEYQDSNLIQEEILKAVSGNEDGVFNRFMVGDVKQSIYGFRQARPDIFIEKYDAYPVMQNEDDEKAASCGNERIDLHTNYRSRPEVIDTVNIVFQRLMTKELGGIEYDDAAALRYGGVYPSDDAKRLSEFILIDRKSPDLEGASGTQIRKTEAALVAERIKEVVGKLPVYDRTLSDYRPCRYLDIAVLFQVTSGVADLYSRVFTEAGIPSHSVSKEGYFSATEVVTVLSCLSILDNPIQDIPFASVLFSPIADFSAEEMAQIRAAEKKGSYYHACLQYLKDGPNEQIRAKLQAFMEQYESLRKRSAYTPVYELIEDIYSVTGYRNIAAAMPAGEQRAANLDMLAAKARKFEQSSYHGLFNFIRYIEKLKKYSMDEGEVNIFSDTADTVRLMSIHKSKGLEFPVVFLCDTAHKFNVQDTNGRFLFHPDLGIGMDVCDLEKHRIVPGLTKERIAQKRKEEIYAENLRVLYVALTRAREKLFITAAEKDLEKMADLCREVRLSHKETVSKDILMKQDHFSAWLMLALYGEKFDCVKTGIETAISIQDKLTGQRIRENGFYQQLQDLSGDTVYDAEVEKALREIRGFRYPFAMPKGIPTKVTVSQLKVLSGDMSEEETGEVFEKEPVAVPYVPVFESEDKKTKITGAQRGTIYHKVFEKIDYTVPELCPGDAGRQIAAQENRKEPLKPRFDPAGETEARLSGAGRENEVKQIENYVNRLFAELKEKGVLSEKEAQSVSPGDFVRFLISPIGKRMRAAGANGLLKREQAFTFSIPANEADPSWPKEENLLVQGIIDAFFEEDGQMVIVDYKTDYVPDDGASLVDKYKKQVYYYARALEAAAGRKVKEQIIYSTYLGRELAAGFGI